MKRGAAIWALPVLSASLVVPPALRARGDGATSTRRRQLAAAVAAFVGGARPQPGRSMAPPRGNIALLRPILESRIAIAELGALVGDSKRTSQWAQMRVALNAPPFTRPNGVVGDQWAMVARTYERALTFDTASLSAADRTTCFPRYADAECAKLVVNADLDYRGLLRADVLTYLQAADDELALLAECERDGRESAAAACKASSTIGAVDALGGVGAAMDRYLDTVGADEVRRGVESLADSLAARSGGAVTIAPLGPPGTQRGTAPKMCLGADGSQTCS